MQPLGHLRDAELVVGRAAADRDQDQVLRRRQADIAGEARAGLLQPAAEGEEVIEHVAEARVAPALQQIGFRHGQAPVLDRHDSSVIRVVDFAR